MCVTPSAIKNTSFRFPVIKDCSALAARGNVYLNWPLIHRRRFARILKHCNLWIESKTGDAPGIVVDGDVDFILDTQYIPMDNFLTNF